MDSKFREQRYNLTYSILRVFIHCLLVDIFHPELLSKDINAIEKLFQIAIAVFLLINFYNFTTILNASRTFLDFYTISIVQYFFLFFFIPYSLSIFFYSIILFQYIDIRYDLFYESLLLSISILFKYKNIIFSLIS